MTRVFVVLQYTGSSQVVDGADVIGVYQEEATAQAVADAVRQVSTVGVVEAMVVERELR